jgi:hypothetical protein
MPARLPLLRHRLACWLLGLSGLFGWFGLLDCAQAGPGGNGFSYRDSYRNLLWFEKYGQPKHLIVQHLQLVPDGPATQSATQAAAQSATQSATQSAIPAATLTLALVGQTTRLQLPLDDTGRTSLPLQKSAYDENAALQINQNGRDYRLQPRISIALRPDGLYPIGQLRQACEQVLAYQNWREALGWRGKKCIGVRFVFGKNDEAAKLDWRGSDGVTRPLALQAGSAFSDDPHHLLPGANFLFAAGDGQIHSHRMALAIAALFE